MTSQRQTNTTITAVSDAAKALRKAYKPSQITAEYPIDLQIIIMGACPTVDCCAKVKSPMLCVLSEAFPAFIDRQLNKVENMAISWMQGQLIAVSAFTNVRDKMSDWQMTALCQQILADYPTTTMLEFVLFCARLRTGMYEDFYGSVDPMRIIKSFRSFMDDRKRDYDRKYEEERKARAERYAEESKKNTVGREYIEEQVKQGKLLTVAKLFGIEIPDEYQEQAESVTITKPVPGSKKEEPEDIVKVAKSLLAEKDAKVRLEFEKIFKKKYGCYPQEYIDKNDK